ncbi:hypothetical protein ALC57_13446 [Trachymyrmex cornetzi]|uniref:Uncharacterized protein n=1 Tax=Trachymyrmex cornetzi TaxID=471704 RepID=A0A195DP64_9HYME|nr:hypothetical protein ALC57_13446 [Trachymyrmex cornetzi]
MSVVALGVAGAVHAGIATYATELSDLRVGKERVETIEQVLGIRNHTENLMYTGEWRSWDGTMNYAARFTRTGLRDCTRKTPIIHCRWKGSTRRRTAGKKREERRNMRVKTRGDRQDRRREKRKKERGGGGGGEGERKGRGIVEARGSNPTLF